MIEYFFPTPVYFDIFAETDVQEIQLELQNYEQSLEKKKLCNPWGDTVSTNFIYGPYDHTLDNLPTLREKIMECVSEYLTGINVTHSEIVIKESWINYSSKGGFQNYHIHEGYDVSGVYFCKTNNQDGDLVFLNPSLMNRFHKITSIEFSKISYTPEVGKLILFPSFLEHSVGINFTDSERVSISFNILVK